MFKLSLLEGIKNIDKNKVMTYLTIFLFAFLFLIQGYTYSYYTVSQRRSMIGENEVFSKYKIYNFVGSMDMFPIYLMNNFGDELPSETMEFIEELNKIEELRYVCEDFQYFKIKNFKGDPKVFVDSYYYEYIEKDNMYFVYAVLVSPNFHKTESYRVIEGRNFTDEDMVFVKGEPRPVLLGYKYRDYYKIGDIINIESNVMYEDLVNEIEVIGFLEEDTSFIDRSGTKVYDMDNYIVAPAIYMTWDEYLQLEEKHDHVFSVVRNANYLYSLFDMKLYIPFEYENEVLAEIQKTINEYSGVAQCVKLNNVGQASLKWQSRTESVTSFFIEITFVVMFFAVVTVLISITNRVSRNMKDYAIHITVGATRGNAVMFIVAEMGIILTCSIILGLVATKWMMNYIFMPFYFWRFLGVYALTSVVILVLSAIVARIAMRKYDICNLIK